MNVYQTLWLQGLFVLQLAIALSIRFIWTSFIYTVSYFCFVFERNEPNAMVELLKHKANVNIVNKKKQTPLHIAVGVTSPECIKILLKANADPSMKVLVSNINFTDTIIHDAKILDCPNDKKYYKLIAFQK